MPNPVVHFEVVGKDGKKLQDFYGQLFDWQIDANNPMQYGLVEAQEGHGIGGGVGPSPMGNWATFYVQVKDPQASLDKATSLGGQVVMPVTHIPGMVTMAQFKDPEGNLVGIVGEEIPPAQ
jgi:predicted enzyme related to lactoylglutathione lyase